MLYWIASVYLLVYCTQFAASESQIECNYMEGCNCYANLVSEIVNKDSNLFELQNKFFPPNSTSPAFLTVSYKFESGQEKIWYWSEAYFYFLHPLHVLQFTSLFFSDLNLESSNIELTLPDNCSQVEDRYLMLLTQRLKLYATRSSLTSPIPDEYNPVAQSHETLGNWHNTSASESIFISTNFIFFPIFTMFLLLLTIVYFNECVPHNRSERIKKVLKQGIVKANNLKWNLQNEFILSLLSTVYMLSLSAAALIFANETDKHLKNGTLIFSGDSSIIQLQQQRLLSFLPFITFTIDFIILTTMIATALVNICNACKIKNYYLIMNICATLSSICLALAIMAVAIIIIYYKEGQKEAAKITSGAIILVTSIIMIIIIIIIVSIIRIKCVNDTCNNKSSNKHEYEVLWRYCAYSITFPLCCIANHLNYIIIAAIHNLYHATSVALVYGVVLLFFYGFLKQVSHMIWKICCKRHSMTLQLLLKGFMIILLSGYMAFSILLYVFLPIDNEFDVAANHFISIYQTVFLLLTAVASYWIISKPFRSSISIFTKAESEYNVIGVKDAINQSDSQSNDNWDNLTDKDRDLYLAKKILSILRKQEEFLKNKGY